MLLLNCSLLGSILPGDVATFRRTAIAGIQKSTQSLANLIFDLGFATVEITDATLQSSVFETSTASYIY